MSLENTFNIMIWYSSSWVESSFANAWVSSPNLSNETIQCLDRENAMFRNLNLDLHSAIFID